MEPASVLDPPHSRSADMDSMEIIDAAQAWAEENDELVFNHSKIILRRKDDGHYFYARTSKRLDMRDIMCQDLDGLELTEIIADDVWPAFDANFKFTLAPQPLPDDVYTKRQRLLNYGDTAPTWKFTDLILDEVSICELLAKHPHPRIAQYLGCLVEDGRITGLCFRRYSMTLDDKVSSGDPFDKEACLQGIEDGIKHLHQLGLVHNDLNPMNVMVDSDGTNPVVIDFDSCRREGEELGLKWGTNGWAKEGITHSNRENDLYGLAKIREFLMESDGSEEKEA